MHRRPNSELLPFDHEIETTLFKLKKSKPIIHRWKIRILTDSVRVNKTTMRCLKFRNRHWVTAGGP